jgi:hypothetical protein
MTVEDSPSPAELEFIERVRGDSARGRMLFRRALAAAAASIAVIAAVLMSHGVPVSRSGGDDFRSAGPWALTDALPGGPTLPVTASAHGLNAPSDAAALEQRIARLEARLKTLEHAAALAEPDARGPVAAVAPASTRAAVRPEKGAAQSRPKPTAPVRASRAFEPASTRAIAVAPARQVVRPEPPAQTLRDHMRRGWASIERGVRSAPQDLREGVNRITRLFAD